MNRIVAPLLALAVTTGSLTAMAQTKSKTSAGKKATAAETEKSKYHRLPSNFGKLELAEDQKTDIYAIKDDYGSRIDELRAEIALLQEDMSEEIDDVLTNTQRTALAKLQSASKTRTTSVSSAKSGTRSSTKKGSSRSRRTKVEDDEE